MREPCRRGNFFFCHPAPSRSFASECAVGCLPVRTITHKTLEKSYRRSQASRLEQISSFNFAHSAHPAESLDVLLRPTVKTSCPTEPSSRPTRTFPDHAIELLKLRHGVNGFH